MMKDLPVNVFKKGKHVLTVKVSEEKIQIVKTFLNPAKVFHSITSCVLNSVCFIGTHTCTFGNLLNFYRSEDRAGQCLSATNINGACM